MTWSEPVRINVRAAMPASAPPIAIRPDGTIGELLTLRAASATDR